MKQVLKQALLLLPALLLCLCFAGCGAAQTAAQLTQPQPATAPATAPTTAPTTAATTRETTTEPATEPTAAAPAPFSPDDVAMTATPGSSCFSEVGYSETHRVLVVRFRDSGKRYSYFEVPSSVWTAFRSADSLGRYYNTRIKGYYSCEKG